MTNILDYLEQTLTWLPDKTAFRDEANALTFRGLYQRARAVGTCLHRMGLSGEAVGVALSRGPETVAAYLACIYAGCFFLPLEDIPAERMAGILRRAGVRTVLCDAASEARLGGTGLENLCLRYAIAAREAPDDDALRIIRQHQIDGDPVCLLPISGREPLEVLLNHRTLLEHTEHLGAALGISSNTVFGCQASLNTVDCLKEILCTLKYGASCYLIPQRLFSFPGNLISALNYHRVDTICWASSAIFGLSASEAFARSRPENLRTVAFSGEPIPIKHLRLWQSALPGARFFRLYGMTETGGACCCYPVPETVGESVPLGKPFANTGLLLLNAQGEESDSGEICLRGSCLAMGYLGNPQATARAFRDDGLRRIFHTGDYAARNDRGELVLLGRQDSRVICRGRSIDLTEIEAVASDLPGVTAVCCRLEETQNRLQLFYTGACDCQTLTEHLRSHLPAAMIPGSLYRLRLMPLTPGGAVDRKLLARNARQGVYGYESPAVRSM